MKKIISILSLAFIMFFSAPAFASELTADDLASLQNQLNDVGNTVRELQGNYQSLLELVKGYELEYSLLSEKADLANQLYSYYIDTYSINHQKDFESFSEYAGKMNSNYESLSKDLEALNKATVSGNSVMKSSMDRLNDGIGTLIELTTNDITNEEMLSKLTESLDFLNENTVRLNNYLGLLVGFLLVAMCVLILYAVYRFFHNIFTQNLL